MTAGEVSPREFEALQRRVEQMDVNGTRGVSGVSIQLANAIADLNQLRLDFKEHEKEHEKERLLTETVRSNNRRFRITASAAWLATASAMIGILLDIASHVHH